MNQQTTTNNATKTKVKFLDSIAGLGDPKSPAELDAQYRVKIALLGQGREKPFSQAFCEEVIATYKKRDRYGEKPIGFARDFSFKIGDEAMIPSELAEKWQDAGICLILPTAQA